MGRRRLSKPLFRPYCRIKKPNRIIMAACPAAESKNARSTLSVISMLAIVVISIAGIVTRMTILPTFLFDFHRQISLFVAVIPHQNQSKQYKKLSVHTLSLIYSFIKRKSGSATLPFFLIRNESQPRLCNRARPFCRSENPVLSKMRRQRPLRPFPLPSP